MLAQKGRVFQTATSCHAGQVMPTEVPSIQCLTGNIAFNPDNSAKKSELLLHLRKLRLSEGLSKPID